MEICLFSARWKANRLADKGTREREGNKERSEADREGGRERESASHLHIDELTSAIISSSSDSFGTFHTNTSDQFTQMNKKTCEEILAGRGRPASRRRYCSLSSLNNGVRLVRHRPPSSPEKIIISFARTNSVAINLRKKSIRKQSNKRLLSAVNRWKLERLSALALRHEREGEGEGGDGKR